MSRARSIFVVGYLIPIGTALLVGSVALTAWTKFDNIREQCEQRYKRYKIDRKDILTIAPSLPKYQPRIAVLHSLLSPDQYGGVGESFKTIETTLDPRVARRIGYRQMDAGELTIPGVKIPMSGLSVTWNGKLPQVQSAALQIEIERPNLFLTSLTADIEAGQRQERQISLVEKYAAIYADQPLEQPAAPTAKP